MSSSVEMQESNEQYLSSCPYGPNGAIPGSQPIPPMISPGLQSLYETCLRAYPSQPNPLQVTAVLKYW